jgi:FMN phosphatase YigB (HAD superfamily)
LHSVLALDAIISERSDFLDLAGHLVLDAEVSGCSGWQCSGLTEYLSCHGSDEANGLRIMVVSEGPHDAQEVTLKRLGIELLADLLVISTAKKTFKRGGLLKIALGRARCAPHELIYVGDSLENDIGPAQEAGVPNIYVGENPAPAGTVKLSSLLDIEQVLNAVSEGTWAGRPK